MRIKDLVDFIESLYSFPYFYNKFPREHAPDECAAVRLTGGFPVEQWLGKRQPSFQILVRGLKDVDDPDSITKCEEKAFSIHSLLTNRRDFKIGTESVVVIRAMNSVPIYIGDDDAGRPIYSMNFDVVIRPNLKEE
ncbi:hypothetical protein FZC76_21620 [Sutcliffiella horikoshii]|uniref:Tail terminator n=1 Tax=Sutcliffiella horikoshii TaxID=79883 RepID=A0A5D4SED5_9BACI|nr:minor capsid protein [Sutcliffiella horikoshii]TYS60474.1 hypothetical protein FZC76_21620 [Sutcliffiella horikoshii]